MRFTPISEAAFTGIGLGAAGSGFRPVVHWGMVTFSFVAMDQIVNQASKIRYMFGGQADFPVTYRCTTGGGAQIAAQHSQSPYSMFMHLAGLKIILPVDAGGRQGAAQERHPRQQSGDLLRVQSARPVSPGPCRTAITRCRSASPT